MLNVEYHMIESNKLRQLWYDMRHQSVVTWVTLVGTALSVFLLMVVITLQQINIMPFAPETNRPRLMYGQNFHVRGLQHPDNNSSAGLSYAMAEKLYSGLNGVELSSYINIDTWKAEVEGSTMKPFKATVRKVDDNFWKIFDHTLLEGRYFDKAEVDAGQRLAVLSRTTARKLFGDAKAVGAEFMLNFQPYTVAGIVEDNSALARQASGEVFIPMSATTAAAWDNDGYLGDVAVALLLAEGTDPADLRSQVKARYAQLATELAPADKEPVYHQTPYDVATVVEGEYGSNNSPDNESTARGRLITYLLLLLLPAINLAGMLHSRIRRRVGEFGIRRAFGCTRWRIVRDIINENFIVTLGGGIAGWCAAMIFLSSYEGLYTAGWIGVIHATPSMVMLLNWRFILAVLAVCFTLNFISASIPAWQASRLNTVDAINGHHNS